LALVIALTWGVACGPEPTVEPPLDEGERQLVDAYVRLSILEALRPDYPDSVDAVLDSLAAAWDSTRILEQVDALQEQPFRWERIFMVINAELTELQRSPDNYWKAVHQPQLLVPERTVPDPSPPATESAPESDR